MLFAYKVLGRETETETEIVYEVYIVYAISIFWCAAVYCMAPQCDCMYQFMVWK